MDRFESRPIKTTKLCSYGCGRVARYRLKNGKLCCSKGCLICILDCRRQINNRKKQGLLSTIKISKCNYECGQIANYKLKNGKYCCSDHPNKCPENIKLLKEAHILDPIETTELCSFGCGQVAKYKLKNGKICCSNPYVNCPEYRRKLNEELKLAPIETIKLCSYGCGQKARYKLKNGKLCCSKHSNRCPIKSKEFIDNMKFTPINPKIIKPKTNIKIRPIKINLSVLKPHKLCSYGCGQKAMYKTKSGKLCCSDHPNKCPVNIKKIIKNWKNNHIITPIETTELCEYGCGQIAKYKTKTGKLCCNKSISQCPAIGKKISENEKGKLALTYTPIETKRKCSYGCGQIAHYQLKNGKVCCSNHISKCPAYGEKLIKSRKKRKRIKIKYGPIETTELCSYGCGQIAQYRLKNKKLCCSRNHNICPATCKKLSEVYKKNHPTKDKK